MGRLEFKGGHLCCMLDQEGVLLYCVITTKAVYPERLAYLLLFDVISEVGTEVSRENVDLMNCEEFSLDSALKKKMTQLVYNYEDSQSYLLVQAPDRQALRRGTIETDAMQSMPNATARRSCLDAIAECMCAAGKK